MNAVNITLELSAEMAKKLDQLAQEQRCTVAGAALEILKTALYDPITTNNPNDLPYEVWRERFEEWIKNVPQVNVGFVDDSREAIYEGRGG